MCHFSHFWESQNNWQFRRTAVLQFFEQYATLLLPGEINISQLQGKIEFNTFFFWKPYNWYIKLLNIILVVLLVGWWVLLVILVIFGDFWWFWVIFWWFLMDFSTYLAISTSYFSCRIEKSHGASNFLKSQSSSPPWATLGRIPTILTAI